MSGSIRYSRQVTLAGWGESGQAHLAEARALVVGMGGLGIPAATYLAAAGIGQLQLNDYDTVDESNLARQPIYTPGDIGRLKVTCSADYLAKQNPDCEITQIDSRLNSKELQAVVSNSDVVLDCSDNFVTRFAVNEACVQQRKPLVSGASIRYESQLTVFRADLQTGPCYRCLYDEKSDELEDCRGQGVVAPMVGMIGSAMALEALRVIVGFGSDFHSRVLLYEATRGQWREVRLQRDSNCPVCSTP